MLFVPPSLSDLDPELCNGTWSRAELEEMDARFCEALERAFANGRESRAAAAATVQIKSSLNGSRRLDADAAIGGVWQLFVEAKFDMTAVEVLKRVRAVCPKVSAETIRVEFWKRLRGSDGAMVRSGDGPRR